LAESMFLRTPRVEAADICGCKWSWSWEHDLSLDKGLTRVDQTQYKASSLCASLSYFIRLY
jgi:hypothetical protein